MRGYHITKPQPDLLQFTLREDPEIQRFNRAVNSD